MGKYPSKAPELIVTYQDPEEGFHGFLVIDTLGHEIAAGGLRVKKGLRVSDLILMARNMTLKQRIAGLRVDGAKSGIDYDPRSPKKREAIFRFMRAIRPYIRERYSMGPDVNTTLEELDGVAAGLDIPAVKFAITKAQGLAADDFLQRYHLLGKERKCYWTLGKVRAGYGVAIATLSVLERLGISPNQATVTIQGFGTVGRATAHTLARRGIRIVALSDINECIFSPRGASLDVDLILRQVQGTSLPTRNLPSEYSIGASKDIYKVKCDILIPAAIEHAITREVAGELQGKVKALVPGANLAVDDEAEEILWGRGVLVLPDFAAGCGGSICMDGLFGPKRPPAIPEVLGHIECRMRQIVAEVLERSEQEQVLPKVAALRICRETPDAPQAPPYGAEAAP